MRTTRGARRRGASAVHRCRLLVLQLRRGGRGAWSLARLGARAHRAQRLLLAQRLVLGVEPHVLRVQLVDGREQLARLHQAVGLVLLELVRGADQPAAPRALGTRAWALAGVRVQRTPLHLAAAEGHVELVKLLLSSGARFSGGRASGAAIPPTPKRLPAEVLFGKVEGEERGEDAMDPPIRWTDDLFWLRDDERKSDGVLSHLKAENAYTDALTAHLADARTSLYAELKGHVKETDTSAPVPWGDYEYFTKTEEGKSYRIHCR